MFQYIPHSDIDFQRYNDCVANSLEPIVYVESWFLDIVTQKDWDILVYNNYEAVMPIPYARMKRSFWKKSLAQPYFAQQLGVISKVPIAKEVHLEFLNELKKLKPLVYHLNYLQTSILSDLGLRTRKNYVLDLNKSYEELYYGFSTSKRQGVKKGKQNSLKVSNITIDEFVSFQAKHMPLKESAQILKKKKQLFEYCLNRDLGEIYAVKKEKEVVSVAFFTKYRNKFYYSQSAASEMGRKLFATDFILNYIIEKHAKTPTILDFEGSEIPGIGKFMERFGAENHPYIVVSTKQ